MAIRSTYKQRADADAESASALFNIPASGNPPAFRATGRGWFNKYPNFAANIANANGSFTNLATSRSNDDLYKIWLFVDAVETSWALAGETGQGQLGRVFYPRNMTQNEFTIEGQCSNQYEYDKIAQFVEHHHFSQVRPQGLLAQSLDANNYPALDFKLFKPANSHTFDGFAPMHYSVVIEDMAAGHEKFLNFPTYSLSCKVVYDYLEPPYHIQQSITKSITRKQIFGAATSPSPSTGSS